MRERALNNLAQASRYAYESLDIAHILEADGIKATSLIWQTGSKKPRSGIPVGQRAKSGICKFVSF